MNEMTINSGNFGDALNCSMTTTGGGDYSLNHTIGDNLIGTTGNTGNAGDCTYTYPNWIYPDVYHYYHHYYWPYSGCQTHYEKSKVDVAFKVMKKLMDMKILNVNKLTVGKFIELVHELSKEL